MLKTPLLAFALLSFATSAFATPISAVQKNAISAKDIIGEWRCTILYKALNTVSIDQIDFQADGNYVNTSVIIVHKALTYEDQHSGHWHLQDNILSHTSTQHTFGRIHSSQMEKRLKNEPQLKKDEEQFFKGLSKNANNGEKVNFEIMKWEKDRMIIDHVWDNATRHYGECLRKK
ncbi:hypothetical protein A4G18_02485 [Pasteurellaceae bacterium Pebbles2]|nr:hypothetical protein [Pasteurellaceae bacterium Pebbles2]